MYRKQDIKILTGTDSYQPDWNLLKKNQACRYQEDQ